MATQVHTPGPQTVPAEGPTGTWRHPRFDEIQRRLNATTFTNQNVHAILRHLAVLALVTYLPSISAALGFSAVFGGLFAAIAPLDSYILKLLQIVPILGTLRALSPLLRTKDDLSDIALTPQQRVLLGLGPASRPATPGSQYITPPRYAKSIPRSASTSRSGSPYSAGSSMGSGTPGATFSPNASPLLQRTVGKDLNRRLSFGSPSPLSLGNSMITNDSASLFLPSTPTPLNVRGSSVPLNNKWLYERGRRSSSGMRSVYS